MSNSGKLIKSLLKTKKESVMGKLGDSPYENPMEPWSAKYNAPVKEGVAEGSLNEVSKKMLGRYVNKARDDLGSAINHSYRDYEDDEADEKDNRRAEKRQSGIDLARAKINKSGKSGSVVAKVQATEGVTESSTKTDIEQITEDTWLFKYIRSLGYNPRIMSFAQRSKYARSNKFKFWKQAHLERGANFGDPQMNQANEEVEELDEAGTGLLMTFIKAKGLNPLTMDGNQKHHYSRSSEFRVFKQKHSKSLKETSGMGERGEDWNEEKEDNPPFDKPYSKVKVNVTDKSGAKHSPLSRAKHLARLGILKALKKNLKEEADDKDNITMNIPLLIRMLEYAREDAKTDMDLHKVVENLIKKRNDGVLSMSDYEDIIKITEEVQNKLNELKKIPDNMDSEDHITREMKDPCWKGYQMVGTKKKGTKKVPNCVPEQVTEGIGNVEDSPLSATNSVKAMESAHREKQMKSARMIKSLYKKKIKETTYDWEKDDKPSAKIVVKGGTTLTGQPRDTVEIEPALKTRPNQQKPTV